MVSKKEEEKNSTFLIVSVNDFLEEAKKFMAPEIINEEEKYDEKIYVYSFGVLIFFILSGGQIPKIKIGDILKGKKAEIPSTNAGTLNQKIDQVSKKLLIECPKIISI